MKSMRRIPIALAATLLVAVATLVPDSTLRASAPSTTASDIRINSFFNRFREKEDNYERLRFARNLDQSRDLRLRQAVTQMLATELSIFGRVAEAEALFPRGQARLPEAPLPTPDDHDAVPALDFIIRASEGRRVVMLNEAHHSPQTRLLTLALLPGMREAGFTHLALEGLTTADTELAARGYPVEASGFYLGEPLYGEIARRALALGFSLVAYDEPYTGTRQDRELQQALMLRDVLEADPEARLFIHAGYAHIDKAPGQLGNVRPLALELIRLTGIDPLSIDQTLLGLGDPFAATSTWQTLLASFPVQVPSVLVASETGQAWSLRPDYHDATVLLPDPQLGLLRPEWLSVGGQRQPFHLDSDACRDGFPCLVEARYAREGDDAVPADQFVLFSPEDARWPLYLAPGSYRLRIRGPEGHTVSTRSLTISPEPTH